MIPDDTIFFKFSFRILIDPVDIIPLLRNECQSKDKKTLVSAITGSFWNFDRFHLD